MSDLIMEKIEREYLLNGYEQCSKVFFKHPSAIKAVYQYESDRPYLCSKTGQPTTNAFMLIVDCDPKDPENKRTYKKIFSVHPDHLDDTDPFDQYITNEKNHTKVVLPREFIATADTITMSFMNSKASNKCIECKKQTNQIFKSMYKKEDGSRPIYKKYWCTDCSSKSR